MPKYPVICTQCKKSYYSDASRDGLCPECRITVRGKRHTAYRDNNYDRLTVYVSKGEKEKLKSFVSDHGMSLNEFISKAITQYKNKIEADEKKNPE